MAEVLAGRVAIVTGASRGIGRALAIGFAKEGATVVAAARTERPGAVPGTIHETIETIRRAGGKALAVRCDISQVKDVQQLVQTALNQFGQIDIFVQSAAVIARGGAVALDPEAWDRVMAVNVRGTFLTSKYVLPHMVERQRGNIVNITGPAAVLYEHDHVAYPAAKAANERFTLNVAGDVKKYNIAVNALRPGLVDTEMIKGIPEDVLAGRVADPPEAVVPAALWLVQQDASTFTGQIVDRREFGKTWP